MTTPEVRPDWARRIRAEREARDWSQAKAASALQAHANAQSFASVLRQWKRWEAGGGMPDEHNQRLIARTFGIPAAVIFPPPRRPAAANGMDLAEILARLCASGVDNATLQALDETTDRLCCDYGSRSSPDLRTDGQLWLGRITGLLDHRLTLAQHREVLSLAGRVALLVGCVEYDMDLRTDAEATRIAAYTLGGEAGNTNVVGWSVEMRAWYALTRRDYRAVIAAADEGLAVVDGAHSVGVQLAAHKAKAWARIGDRRQLEVALDQGRALLEQLPPASNLANHFVVDPAKWDFYTMDCYRHVGEDRLAATYAREVLRNATNADGVVMQPMRAAEARITLGVVAARQGDLDGALAEGRVAIKPARRSLPSLVMNAGELVGVMRDRFPTAPEVDTYADELQMLRAA